MGEQGSCVCCLLVELMLFGSCCCLNEETVLGDMGGVLADDVSDAEVVGVRFEGFPDSGIPRGKEEVINAMTSAEIR